MKKDLDRAKKNKADEYYTLYSDIEKELNNYKDFFKNKIVFCNCEIAESNFISYFKTNFQKLDLKELLYIIYSNDSKGTVGSVKSINGTLIETVNFLAGSGDFRNSESIELLNKADIVCTNPPFSLFREYCSILINNNKYFLIVGSKNAISYNDFFPLLKDNKVWLGCNNITTFKKSDGELQSFGNIGWYTNIPNLKRNKPIPLTKEYSIDKYPQYDNYNGINVDRVTDIPKDYFGVMGVPITFMDKYCPEQFKIIGLGKVPNFEPTKIYNNPVAYNCKSKNGTSLNRCLAYKIDDIPNKGIYYKADNVDYLLKQPYARILIQRII